MADRTSQADEKVGDGAALGYAADVLAFALAVVTAATPTVAAPGLRTTGIDAQKAVFLSELLATHFAKGGVRVVSQRDLAALMGMERQRELLGCADSQASQCLTELANALGTEAVLIGDLAFFAKRYVVNVKVIAAADGKTLASATFEAADEEALFDQLKREGQKLGEETRNALIPSAAPLPAARGSGIWLLAPAAIGVVGVGVGVALLSVGGSKYGLLTSGTMVSKASADDALMTGPTFVTGGAIALAIGGALALAALVWWLAR